MAIHATTNCNDKNSKQLFLRINDWKTLPVHARGAFWDPYMERQNAFAAYNASAGFGGSRKEWRTRNRNG